ncbi:50S ribosomal protein L21 [bacterium]|nr:50S ribosomal protein L21 [bacterium]
MYAVIETGGKQYKVEEGSVLNIDKTNKKPGDVIELSNILLLVDGERVEIGRPYLDKGTVLAEIKRHVKGKKIIVFKKRRRKEYKKTLGHRQQYTEVKIKEIKIV